jgi:hypothetical protein
MQREIAESDWRHFRKLHPIAVERYCTGVLKEAAEFGSDTSRSAQQRYVALYRLMQQRDREITRLFDDMRRSTAVICILAIHARGLFSAAEFAGFSEEIQALAELLGDGQ